MRGSVIVVGRVSVDLYAREAGASFRDPQTFNKSVGGSPTNVAVAAARLGHDVVLLTKVGSDELGEYVIGRLNEFGVDTSCVGISEGERTPVVIASMDPPEDPRVIFHRKLDAPDTTLQVDALSKTDIEQCDVLWITGGTLARGTTASACTHWLDSRQRRPHTVFDIDFRPSFWDSQDDARHAAVAAIKQSTVVVGNRSECAMALGTDEPNRAVDEMLELGVAIAVVKMGGDGVLLANQRERVTIAPLRVPVVCGLGSGDAFGGALVHGLLSNWDLRTIGEYANAAGAYVAARLSCADSMPDLRELTEFVTTSGRG